MIKFKLYSDKDLEEIFLNDMAAKGYAMTKFFLGIYWFEKCKSGEYTYRIDLVSDKDKNQKKEYYDLIRETGGEIIQPSGAWVFLRKKGEFELYTDNESKIEEYNRIKKAFLLVALCELLIISAPLSVYFWHGVKSVIIAIIALIFTCILCFHQAYKCHRKIESLKN
ncbi:DUF2812 domain-containing protein [Paraclostridium ghonii]|uniref:DUF2812 domain-containing protein n=1 Tax=Paraclostridium ghonii TaxID=29358 RepID=UPI00202CE1C3|nr:DUF2812 domain-containing protein [Paeniclostridium ghonii]MCM0167041.1 DUF2812 domain-containing protein [Paeniclostridium ghonii]